MRDIFANRFPTQLNAPSKNEQSQNYPASLLCTKCAAVVGTDDIHAEGWRLYKWALGVRSTASAISEVHRTVAFISAHILALINSQAVRKFIVHCDKDVNDGLMVCSLLYGCRV